jgi:hypothetical protein
MVILQLNHIDVKLAIPRTDVSNAQARRNANNAKLDPTFTIPSLVRNVTRTVLSVYKLLLLLPFQLILALLLVLIKTHSML